MIKILYLKVSPAALVRVFEARSALTISELRIKLIPVEASDSFGYSFRIPCVVERLNKLGI